MWNTEHRFRAWSDLKQLWDVLIIGGGITGAGLFRMAVNAGLRTALVEACL
jgi:glycerol-3-phosphate dehydrogenase